MNRGWQINAELDSGEVRKIVAAKEDQSLADLLAANGLPLNTRCGQRAELRRRMLLAVEGAPEKTVTLPFHPTADLGSRSIRTAGRFYLPGDDLEKLSAGSVFRLIDLYNLELVESGETPRAKYLGDGLVQGTPKLQWATLAGVRLSVLEPGLLFDDAGKFNEGSLKTVEGVAEEAASGLAVGEVVQFPRFGFCRKDSPERMVLAHK